MNTTVYLWLLIYCEVIRIYLLYRYSVIYVTLVFQKEVAEGEIA
jgi:hypothetical protein